MKLKFSSKPCSVTDPLFFSIHLHRLRVGAEDFLNYPTVQHHSSGSPLLSCMNRLSCETQWHKTVAEHCNY